MIDATTRHTLTRVRPTDRDQLRGWLRAALGIDVPGAAREPGHASPMDYLEHVFFEREGDVVLWANRGGGKTFYGGVATLLDLVFKPGIEVRILGGSLEQSRKMHAYLRWMLERPGLDALVDGRVNERGVRLINGSGVELLAQSQTSVRGHRVQKLRCDEVELFDRDVWEAAQFVTRSAVCGGVPVRGSVEALSTAHRPFGLMSELIETARGAPNDWALFRWNALDVMGVCDPALDCGACALEASCAGRAKHWRGFLPAADVLSQRRRSSSRAFEAEMLCRRPSRRDAVFASFDPAIHVREVEPAKTTDGAVWIGGMDFGMRSPFVMLWAQVQNREVRTDGVNEAGGGQRVVVFDEYVRSDRSVPEHLEAMAARRWPRVNWAGVDPAGHQREQVTGRSVIGTLRDAGWRVRACRTRLATSLETVQRWLEDSTPATDIAESLKTPRTPPDAKANASVDAFCFAQKGCGAKTGREPALLIHPRCRGLIGSLTCYHFDPNAPRNPNPVKDGHDHAADALRYMLVNLGNAGSVRVRDY